MKLGLLMILMKLNGNQWNEGILYLQHLLNPSKYQHLWTSYGHCFGTDKAFYLLIFYSEVKQSIQMFIERCLRNCAAQYRKSAKELSQKVWFSFTTMPTTNCECDKQPSTGLWRGTFLPILHTTPTLLLAIFISFCNWSLSVVANASTTMKSWKNCCHRVDNTGYNVLWRRHK